jgi:hypothetical protein
VCSSGCSRAICEEEEIEERKEKEKREREKKKRKEKNGKIDKPEKFWGEK